MFQIDVQNTQELLDTVTSGFFFGTYPPDDTKADRLYMYDLFITIAEPRNDLDFGRVYWGAKRWQKFGREYLSATPLKEYIRRCVEKDDGASDWAEIGYEFSRAKGSRGHNLLGNCISGMSFHRRPTPRITVTSRVTNFLPVGFLELSLANLLSEEISQRLGKLVPIVWYVTQIQFSIQWSFPYWYHTWLPAHKDEKKYLTPFAQTWVKRLSKRYKDLVTGKVDGYAYNREENLYKKMSGKSKPYFASLEDLGDEHVPD